MDASGCDLMGRSHIIKLYQEIKGMWLDVGGRYGVNKFLTLNQRAVGSSPTAPTNQIKELRGEKNRCASVWVAPG